MSKRADHRRHDNDRLARLLDTPHLAQVVPRLAPEVLHHLIQQRGLEECSALIAAATPQQVASVLDLDLWRASPGQDDQFDQRRFGAWIETLMDEGETVAARVVVEMDRDLAITGLAHYVRVFDPGVLPLVPSTDDELEDSHVAPSAGLEAEIGGYVVHAKTADAWDAIVGLLVTLATEHSADFHSLMQGCRRLSNSTPELDGLDDLLLAPAQLLHDVSLGREHRRSDQGYLTPGDARAFLQMARQPGPSEPTASPITSAYFRRLDDASGSPHDRARLEGRSEESPDDSNGSDSIDIVADLVAEAGLASPQPRALTGTVPGGVATVTPMQRLMERVHDTDPVPYFARNRELAFLANALVAGCSLQARPFTIQEAWEAAVGICNMGLEEQATPLSDTFLADHDLVTAFEAGWRILHENVSLFVGRRLIATLASLRSVDPDIGRDLYRLRRELERHVKAGEPWRAREALDVIAILDMPTWACLCGLLSECPVLPVALTALLEGHSGPVSATAFDCFTTREQLPKVHLFADRLAELLL